MYTYKYQLNQLFVKTFEDINQNKFIIKTKLMKWLITQQNVQLSNRQKLS